MDIDRPTDAQIANGRWIKPRTTQRSKVTNWKRKDVISYMVGQRQLNVAQYEALQRLERHILGSLGYDTRLNADERVDLCRGDYDNAEIKKISHGNHVAEVKKALTRKQFTACECLLSNMTTLEIGRLFLGRTAEDMDQKMVRGYALCAIHEGLDTLTAMWGLTSGVG